MNRIAVLVTALVVCAPLVCVAQDAATPVPEPTFEVVSIKPLPPLHRPIMVPNGWTPFLPGAKFSNSHASVAMLIIYAYDIRRPSLTLSGLPEWTKTKHVDWRGASLGCAERPAYARPAGDPREPQPAGAAPLRFPGA